MRKGQSARVCVCVRARALERDVKCAAAGVEDHSTNRRETHTQATILRPNRTEKSHCLSHARLREQIF